MPAWRNNSPDEDEAMALLKYFGEGAARYLRLHTDDKARHHIISNICDRHEAAHPA